MQIQNHPLTWVVVADKCQARVYRLVKFPNIEEITFLEHPDSRLYNQDLVSSKPGRNFQSGGTTRHAYQPETEPKQIEAVKFAVEVTNFLSLAEREGQFNRLYLFAEPSFLGLLRKQFGHEIQKKIVGELSKDLTNCDKAVIERHISELNP